MRAQGDLRLLSPIELLGLLHRKRFSGRLVLVSAASPRRILALHLEQGSPVLVIGRDAPAHAARTDAFVARQALIQALGWSAGAFRVETMERVLPKGTPPQELGTAADLVTAAREHAAAWPTLARNLPAPFAEVRVASSGFAEGITDVEQQLVLRNLQSPLTLPELARRTRLDHHVLVRAVFELTERGAVHLGTGPSPPVPEDPSLVPLVSELLGSLTGRDGSTLKLTILAWDARTCFRTVEAVLGRFRRAPEDIESQPRYHILHETAPLSEGLKLEVLAFRADSFEPVFAAPLVQNCHIFLLVTDIEAGHVWGAEQPLADRLNELRSMFQGALVAGRITVGAGAVTDPGSDVIIPEIGRYASWSEVNNRRFLSGILREVARRLGLEPDPPHSR